LLETDQKGVNHYSNLP